MVINAYSVWVRWNCSPSQKALLPMCQVTPLCCIMIHHVTLWSEIFHHITPCWGQKDMMQPYLWHFSKVLAKKIYKLYNLPGLLVVNLVWLLVKRCKKFSVVGFTTTFKMPIYKISTFLFISTSFPGYFLLYF